MSLKKKKKGFAPKAKILDHLQSNEKYFLEFSINHKPKIIQERRSQWRLFPRTGRQVFQS